MSQGANSREIDLDNVLLTKFRSASSLVPASASICIGDRNSLSIEGVQAIPKSLPYNTIQFGKIKRDIDCPIKNPSAKRPRLLMKTHFEISKETIAQLNIVDHIETKIFPTFDSIDFSRDLNCSCISEESIAKVWHGKYLCGATFSLFDLLLYDDTQCNAYIIEVNRTRGDSKPFIQFFIDLKAHFIPMTASRPLPILCNFGSINTSPISDEAYFKGLQAIFRMAKAVNYEARLESAKMLCDLFQQKQTQLQNNDVRIACIECIELLIHDDFADIQQFAVMAMSLMAEVDHSYKMDLMRSSALLLVVKMVVDNPKSPELNFETIQTRRECAKILVTLAADNNYHLLKENIIEQAGMDPNFLQDWMTQVHTIEDYRLRHQTEKAFPDMAIMSFA